MMRNFCTVPVVGERLDDVRAGVYELSVQGGDLVGVIEHRLGNERPGLEVAAPLQLEVALGAHHRSGGEPLGGLGDEAGAVSDIAADANQARSAQRREG